jgi:Mg-chelatase subunit ChlD
MKKKIKAAVKKVRSAFTGKKVLKTQIAIVLDSSGSMQSCQKETVDAFNEQVKTIRQGSKKGMDTRVSLFTFATKADEPKFFNEPVASLDELKQEDYKPDGYTAMYDAVGKAVTMLSGLKEDKDTAYLMVIISDGQENNSKEFTGKMIAEKIKELEGTKHWTFTYLGANQNLADVSKHLNININNTMAFASTGAGVRAAQGAVLCATASYMCDRAVGATQAKNFYGADNTKAKKKDQAVA